MKATIYANYGVLAHEKQTVYTATTPRSDIYDKLIVEIPEEYHPYETWSGAIAIEPDSAYPMMLGDCLYAKKDDTPALRWHDKKDQPVYGTLEIIEDNRVVK